MPVSVIREPPAVRLARQRDAEVGHHRVAVVQQDVVGLDVAVDDALPVRVVERVGGLTRDPHRLVHRELRSRSSRARSDSPSMYGMT